MEDIEILDALNYFSEKGLISSLPAKDNTNRHNKQIVYKLHVRFILQKRV
ncbi:hypothetical protein [Pumilibacter intestinalis]|nr:hypothetical protein [Pumilibacter intestinalis]